MNKTNWITIGFSGALAVALGALGAHALKNQLPGGLITQDQLNGFDTGVKYHMYHTLAMMAVLMMGDKLHKTYARWAYGLFLAGILLFSGSLYFLCTRGLMGAEWLRFLGPVTPLGGICFVAGWLSIGLAGFKKS